MTAPTDAVLAELRTRADENQRAGFGNVTVDCEAVLALLDAYAAAREAIRGIVESGALSEVESVVAGWRGPDGSNAPHPPQLGATIRTNCGRMYKLADALAIARAHLPQARVAEEG